MEFNITVNQNHEFSPTEADLAVFDVVEETTEQYHILLGGKRFSATLTAADYLAKTFSFIINGSPYQVALEDKFDLMVRKMGLNAVQANKVNTVKAPMPGLVLDISVEVGQSVEKGDSICILEAMKMENVIKSVGDGTVKAIHVKKGSAVEKGQLMVEME